MSKRLSLIMIIALFVAAFNLRLSINSVSPILEMLQNDLKMTASIASLLTAIPVLCMGIFSPLAAKLGNRYGVEVTISWALGLISIGTILRFFANSSQVIILTAFISGIGIAAVGPLLSGYIKKYFTNVPPMIAVYTIALTMGAALASGLTTHVEAILQSWKGALGVWSVFGILAILIWCLMVLPRIERPVNPASVTKSSRLPWKNMKAWMLTCSFGLLSMLFYAVTAWLPPIIQSMGYSEIYAGNVLTIFAVIQIPVGLILPQLLKRFPSRLLWLTIAALIELIGFFMIYFQSSPWIAAIFIGLGAGMLFSLNLLLPIDITSNSQEAASWSAMIQSIGYIIGSTGPLIIGWIHDTIGNFSTAIIGMIMINIFMIIIQFFAAPRYKS